MTDTATDAPGSNDPRDLPPYQQKRRQRIIDAATTLLDDHEFETIQMRDVATAAGVAVGTVYRYFASKENLYAVVLREWAGDLRRHPGGKHTRRPPEDRIRARIHGIIDAYEKQPRLFKMQMTLLGTTDDQARREFDAFSDAAHKALVEDLDMADPRMADDIALMTWSVLTTMLQAALYRGRPMADVRRICDGFVDLLAWRLNGTAT
jgi:AcrR family transcriptional regulator